MDRRGEVIDQLQAEIKRLQASETAWKIIAKQNDKWNELPQSEKEAALQKALDSTTEDFVKGEDELDRLRALIAALVAALQRIADDAYSPEDEKLLSEQPTMIWNAVARAAITGAKR